MNLKILKDLKPSFFYLLFPIALLLTFGLVAYQMTYDTIYGRYEYTGPDEMSFFGYLDLAHLRPLAAQEFWSWQFFFGSLQLFIIFSLILTGFLLFYTPVKGAKRKLGDSNNEFEEFRIEKINRVGWIGFAIVCIVIVLEIIASYATGTESGWGPHYYTDAFYRDIPTLIREGFIPTNTKPYFPQMFLSFLPFTFGLGGIAIFHGMKSLRNRGLIEINSRPHLMGFVFFGSGVIYLLILIAVHDLTLQTGFSLLTMFYSIMWVLIGVWVSGWVLILLRKSITAEEALGPKKNHRRGVPLVLTLFTIIFILGAFVVWLLPFTRQTGLMEQSYKYPGNETVGILSVLVFLVIMRGWKKREQGDPIVKNIFLCFFIGFFVFAITAFLGILIGIDSTDGPALMYNTIMPLIFITGLTLFFYMIGYRIREKSAELVRIRAISSQRDKNEQEADLSDIFFQNKRKMILTISAVLLVALPTVICWRLFGERPEILVNNVGYLPDQDKTFFVATTFHHESSGRFSLYDSLTGEKMFEGTLTPMGYKWGRYHWMGNFTELSTEGTYYIEAFIGFYKAKSFEFDIKASYLDNVLKTSVYWFYYQRCGTSTEEIVEGYSGHRMCHGQDAWYLYKLPDNTTEYRNDLNLTGGWHDSGDYNVYGGGLMPRGTYSLVYAFDTVPNFFLRPEQKVVYPFDPNTNDPNLSNDEIPDIIEEEYHGLSFWSRRWYPIEQRFFDSNELAEKGHLRWTVFCAPEYEHHFGNGRYIADDTDWTLGNLYFDQFIQGPKGLQIAASYAAMARLCQTYGFYTQNITQFTEFAETVRNAYAGSLGFNQESLLCEAELYKLTGNLTYLNNAINISYQFIERQNNDPAAFADPLSLAYLLNFAVAFDGIGGCNALSDIIGNQTVERFWGDLAKRTLFDGNIFRYLAHLNSTTPMYSNHNFLEMIMAASLVYRLTNNQTLRVNLYRFITDHFDWLFGRNIDNLCMFEGIGGDKQVPKYHHRLGNADGNLRGAAPGWIADGIEYFPGEPGYEKYEEGHVFRPDCFSYREPWILQSSTFLMATSTFFRDVLGYS